jgi:hypothetical protein
MNAITQVSDRECLIAQFSEVAAEAARLSFTGANVDVRISSTGLDLTVFMPATVGPHCIRNRSVTLLSAPLHIQGSGLILGTPGFSSDQVVTHRFWISNQAPLSFADRVIKDIFHHFALMHQNPAACNVYEEAA